MIREPIFYILGDVETDGHTHVFAVESESMDTTSEYHPDETVPHTHVIKIVGDDAYCSFEGLAHTHIHQKLTPRRPMT